MVFAGKGGVGEHCHFTIKATVLGWLGKLDGCLVVSLGKVVSPDDVLHGELRRDPRPAGNPADTTSEAELKAKPLTFFHRVVDLGIPLRRAKDIIPVCFRRAALGQIYHVGSLVAQLFHGLEVLGDAVNRDIIIEPVPPGARAILRGGVGKSLLEAVRTCVLRRITVACSEHAECG